MRLVIDNSVCKLEGMTPKAYADLKKILFYEIDQQQAYFSRSWSRKRYLIDAKGQFPTGLLYLVEGYLRDKIYERIDHRRRPEPRQGLFVMSKHPMPYPEQIDAMAASVRAGRGIIQAVTGSGKSLIAALIVNALQVPTLIVVPSLGLKKQLTDSMREWFGEERVGELGSALAIENVDALDPKKPLKGYDCIIIDEFHHSGAKTYRDLNRKAWNGVYHRFGLTATPFRSKDTERLLLESVLSEVIYRLDYHTAVDKGYVVPVEAYYIDVTSQELDSISWPEVYSKLVVKNLNRNNKIVTLLMKLPNVLCLVKEIAHGELIQDMMLRCGDVACFATGVDENTAEYIRFFNEGSGKLIGTNGVLGEGQDTRPAEYIIIAGLGKSKNQFMQQIGRGLRRYPGKESCKIILFRDVGHKFTLNHFKAQCKILKEEYGVIPAKINLTSS